MINLKEKYENYFAQKAQNYKMCIFGLGALGRETIKWLVESRIPISYISDNNAERWDTYDDYGIRIVPPSYLLEHKEEIYVIVAVSNKEIKYNNEINNQLKDLKNIFRNPLGYSSSWNLEDYCDIKGDLSSLFNASRNCFFDDYSKKLYEKLWKYRQQDRVIDYPLNEMDSLYTPNQYIVRDLIDYSKIRNIVDIGAYSGDTLFDFLDAKIGNTYYCFELDVKIFDILKRNVYKLENREKERIHLFNVGISDKCEDVSYQSDLTGGSRIAEGAGEIATVRTLDSLRLSGDVSGIDMIKMDIEGAEEAAIKGAYSTIKTDHPFMAISIYHSVKQYLKVPIMIKEIEPRYKLFLRHHKYTLDDTVMYAVFE